MKKSLICLMILFFSVTALNAASLSFIWDPNTEPDLEGYKIHYGPESGNYTTTVDIKTDLSGRPEDCTTFDPFDQKCCIYTISGLDDGMHYFTATAYDTDNNESAFSNEIYQAIDTTPPNVITNFKTLGMAKEYKITIETID